MNPRNAFQLEMFDKFENDPLAGRNLDITGHGRAQAVQLVFEVLGAPGASANGRDLMELALDRGIDRDLLADVIDIACRRGFVTRSGNQLRRVA